MVFEGLLPRWSEERIHKTNLFHWVQEGRDTYKSLTKTSMRGVEWGAYSESVLIMYTGLTSYTGFNHYYFVELSDYYSEA
jgi:hypothetical protein